MQYPREGVSLKSPPKRGSGMLLCWKLRVRLS